MKFYHGTSEESWTSIQNEGVLFGRRFEIDSEGRVTKELSRCTYLALSEEDARKFGSVVLEVEYNPFDLDGSIRTDSYGSLNNYSENSWQLRVYEPIRLKNVRRLL